MVLLGIAVVAILIGSLRLATQRSPLPTGSSYSTEPAGAQALFGWLEVEGAHPRRLAETTALATDPPDTIFVIQPETPLEPEARAALDATARAGGTLVVGGDSLASQIYLRNLGLSVTPNTDGLLPVHSADGELVMPFGSRYHLRAEQAAPLLVDAAGQPVAVRMPYKGGTLVAMVTAAPFLNETLRDDATARFVYRELLQAASAGSSVGFDESHHSFVPTEAGRGPVSVNELLFTTAPGRAVIYAAGLVFAYVFLRGRRLGPPVTARSATTTRRTMEEHVQMLAGLYRRGGHFDVVQHAFSQHFGRVLARGGARPPARTAALAGAVRRIETARTESELIAAVAAASDAG
jgi:hypothetical protein